MKLTKLTLSIAACLALVGATSAMAAEAHLKAGYFAPAGSKSPVRGAFEMFVNKVNEDGKGLVQITQKIGPDAIPGFQLGNAVKNGLIDIAGLPPSYAGNLVPGIEALSTVTVDLAEQRKNGAYEMIDGLFKKHMNAHLLGQYGYGAEFYLFLNKKISKVADIKGMRLRTSDTYKAALDAFEAQTIRTKRGEIYTALERGVIDGYPQLPGNVKSNGWHEVTKYVVKPGFYNVSIVFVIGLNSWNKLDDKQKAFLNEVGRYVDTKINEWFVKEAQKSADALTQLGVKTIDLPKDEAEKFRRLAYDAKWKTVEQKAPEYGSELKALLYK